MTDALQPPLTTPIPQPGEMEDVRWFHRDWLAWALQLGPDRAPASFAIPGTFQLPAGFVAPCWGFAARVALKAPPELPCRCRTPAGPYSLAHKLITGWMAASQQVPWAGSDFPQVLIDEGVQKYVLMRLTAEGDGTGAGSSGGGAGAPASKLLVWGSCGAAYHNHIYQQAKAQALKKGLRCEVLGGGRIEHHAEAGVISVYGYSAAFGPAPHEVTAALLRRWYPFYQPDAITISYEGY